MVGGFWWAAAGTPGSTRRAEQTIRDSIAMQRENGADVELLTGAGLTAALPGMRTAWHPPRRHEPGRRLGHQPTIARPLVELAIDAGTTFRRNTVITAIEQRADKITGVHIGGSDDTVPDDDVNVAGPGRQP